MHNKEKIYVNNAVKSLAKDPKIGEPKKGDLAGIFVHKFKIYNQLTLLAYTYTPKLLTLLAMGPHENFYRDLKK